MISIKSNYKNIQNNNPYCGGYICLASAVKSKNFSRKSLVKAFNEIVPKDEYLKAESKGLIDHLYMLTNMPEEGEI